MLDLRWRMARKILEERSFSWFLKVSLNSDSIDDYEGVLLFLGILNLLIFLEPQYSILGIVALCFITMFVIDLADLSDTLRIIGTGSALIGLGFFDLDNLFRICSRDRPSMDSL